MLRWFLIVTLVTTITGVSPGVSYSDLAAQTVDPKLVGLDIPLGPVRPGGGRRVQLTVDDQIQVGRVHVNVGDQCVVLLPDGRLIARPFAQTTETDHSFQPASKEKVAARWLERLPGFQSRATRHYIFIYNTSDDFQAVTSRVLESMIPGLVSFAELVKLKAQDPEFPLVVLMFKSEAQFQAFQRMPPGVVAYYHPLENYVALYEDNGRKDLPRPVAVQQSLATIAHEGAHQILHNIGVQQRLSVWPMWLSEGLAEYLAPTSTGKQLKWKGAGQVNDIRMFELEQYLKSRDADTADGQMVEQTVLAAKLTSTGYASAWALTHHLAKNQRSEFQRLLAEASRLGPLEGDVQAVAPGVVPANLARFRAASSGTPASIERKLIAHLKSLPYTDPFSDSPHWVVLINIGKGNRPRREANVFLSEAQATKWRNEWLEKLPADQRANAVSEVRQFATRPAAEQYIRQVTRK